MQGSGSTRQIERLGNETLREDVFDRLNVFLIHVPPLCERVEDIPLTACDGLACSFPVRCASHTAVGPCRDELLHAVTA